MIQLILFLLGKGWAWGVPQEPTISSAPAAIAESPEFHSVQGSAAGVTFERVEISDGSGFLWVSNGGHRERYQIFQSTNGRRHIRITLRSAPELGEISLPIM